jgi:hypothetical protein
LFGANYLVESIFKGNIEVTTLFELVEYSCNGGKLVVHQTDEISY